MRRRAHALALLLAVAACRASPADPPPVERVPLGLVTALPLLWGEASIDELLAGDGARAPILVAIERRFATEPVDALTSEALAGHTLLLIAQPAVPTPHELVALDRWVRAGGRALILADPMLAWETRYGLGDSRRPPPAQTLGRLLRHWGVAIDPPGTVGRETIAIDGQRVTTIAPGRLRRLGGGCAVAARLARCRIDQGDVMIVPDADLIDAAAAGDAFKTNVDAVIDLLLELSPQAAAATKRLIQAEKQR